MALIAVLSLPALAFGHGYKEGGVAGSARPAMVARRHFGKGVKVRARTIGFSRDEKTAFVVAEAEGVERHSKFWKLEIDRATGRVTTALTGLEYDADQRVRWSEANRLDDAVPADFVRTRTGDVTGRGLPTLTNSGKHLRIGVPTADKDTPNRNVLYPTRTAFIGGGMEIKHGHSGGIIVEDPADHVSVAQVADKSPWYLPHRPWKPNPRPAED